LQAAQRGITFHTVSLLAINLKERMPCTVVLVLILLASTVAIVQPLSFVWTLFANLVVAFRLDLLVAFLLSLPITFMSDMAMLILHVARLVVLAL
jgi:hypothetical protein